MLIYLVYMHINVWLENAAASESFRLGGFVGRAFCISVYIRVCPGPLVSGPAVIDLTRRVVYLSVFRIVSGVLLSPLHFAASGNCVSA